MVVVTKKCFKYYCLIFIPGKFLISMTFAIAYLYTAELFPTKVRNVAVGTASTFARIGSISAPYIVDLLVSLDLPEGSLNYRWILLIFVCH